MAKSKQDVIDSEVPQPTNVYEAINAVMAEVGYVQKQKSAGLNYSYAGEAALIAAVRPHLVQYGVVIYPSGVRDLKTETYTTSKGSVMNRTMGIFAFTFAHAPSNTSFVVEVLGEGADSGDKSANKAMTGALKYAWRQTFGIETGDDPDKYPSEDQERHWTETYDWPAFWAKCKDRGLNRQDVVAALGCEPKLFRDTPTQMGAKLTAYIKLYGIQAVSTEENEGAPANGYGAEDSQHDIE